MCPRSFHFQCIDPPIEEDEIPEGDWYCKECTAKINPPQPYKRSLFGKLFLYLDKNNPTVFMLPINTLEKFRGPKYKEDIVFDVSRPKILNEPIIPSSPIQSNLPSIPKEEPPIEDDNSLKNPARIVRAKPELGVSEESDALLRKLFIQNYEQDRLTDRNGKEIFCAICHTSSVAETPIAKCEICDENWHLKCTTPPLPKTQGAHLPCPNDSSHTLRKLRRPKHIAALKAGILGETPDEKNQTQESTGTLDERRVDGDDDNDNTLDIKTEETTVPKDSQELTESKGTRVLAIDGSDTENEDNDPRATLRKLPIHIYYDTPTGVRAPVDLEILRQFEDEGVVYRLPSTGVKLDFIQAVEEMNQDPYPDTNTSAFLLSLDEIANRDIKGIPRSAPAIKQLLEIALDEEDEIPDSDNRKKSAPVLVTDNSQNELKRLIALKKVIDIRGQDELIKFLSSEN